MRWEGGVREGKGVIYMVAEGCLEARASETKKLAMKSAKPRVAFDNQSHETTVLLT